MQIFIEPHSRNLVSAQFETAEMGKMGERALQKDISEMAEGKVQGNTFSFSALAIGKSIK